jgi:hypothetical protein
MNTVDISAVLSERIYLKMDFKKKVEKSQKDSLATGFYF